MSRVLAIMKKEFLQIKRDRMTLAIVMMIPLIQIILFGFAIQTEVKHIPTVVFDQSLSRESRDMLEAFSASGYFDIMFTAGSYREVNQMIDSGKARVGIVFHPILRAALSAEKPPRCRFWWTPLTAWCPTRP